MTQGRILTREEIEAIKGEITPLERIRRGLSSDHNNLTAERATDSIYRRHEDKHKLR